MFQVRAKYEVFLIVILKIKFLSRFYGVQRARRNKRSYTIQTAIGVVVYEIDNPGRDTLGLPLPLTIKLQLF